MCSLTGCYGCLPADDVVWDDERDLPFCSSSHLEQDLDLIAEYEERVLGFYESEGDIWQQANADMNAEIYGEQYGR